MKKIIQLGGTEKLLYELVAPLIMNPVVLKANYNYPFKTTEKFQWFIALNNEKVEGFLPTECRRGIYIINNYYCKEEDVLKSLLQECLHSLHSFDIEAIVFSQHQDLFKKCGFKVIKTWTKYIRMIKEKNHENKN